MTTIEDSTAPIDIPKLPAPVKDFIPYLSKRPDTAIGKVLEPFKTFESELRKVYAQQHTHEAVKDGKLNLAPLFDGHESELKIRARSIEAETDDEKSRYLMPLKDGERKPNGAPAVVSSFKEFQQNFNLFSESSLIDLDWNNGLSPYHMHFEKSHTTGIHRAKSNVLNSRRSWQLCHHCPTARPC